MVTNNKHPFLKEKKKRYRILPYTVEITETILITIQIGILHSYDGISDAMRMKETI